ncbi:MAG: Fe-S cluster assembly protein HesB [Acidimicrobiales bacterium]
MITLTDDAVRAIDGLVGERPSAGLRIFSQRSPEGSLQLGLSISQSPEPSDEVVSQSGCQVFLDHEAAPLVDGRTLDAVPTDGEEVRFSFV